jgi:predicted secreted protein
VSSASDQPMPQPMMMKARSAMASSADEPLSVEPGKGTVNVVVSGTVQLMK